LQKRQSRACLVDRRDYQAKTEEANAKEENAGSSTFEIYSESSLNIREGWGGFQNIGGELSGSQGVDLASFHLFFSFYFPPYLLSYLLSFYSIFSM